MKQNYLNNIPVDEALKLYLGAVKAAAGERKTEIVKTNEAFGRVLSKAAYAVICSPHYNASAIKDFSDIADHRYVNRQKGSGTRILCDYLVKKYGLDESRIEGFSIEEFTHTAVAAQIANGNADCGLGIYSAAKMYGLDFIEICVEEYDFLIDEKAYETDGVQAFLKTLQSEEFKKRLSDMGGYRI